MIALRTHCALGLSLVALTLGLAGCSNNQNKPGSEAGGHHPAVGTARQLALASKPQRNAEQYERLIDNPYFAVKDQPLSTFSAAVDTASYSNLRRHLNEGHLPPANAVRIADMLNYFDYIYPEPMGEHPVAIGLEMAPCPWNAQHHLLKIALKARTIPLSQMPPRNLVFLIDTSGSMNGPNRLPLVKQSLELLVRQLRPQDRVSIVTYAGDSKLQLACTSGLQTERILEAIQGLHAKGSTNGGGGIGMAYDQAVKNFIPQGINRVILATDGDFNVGVTSREELVRLIEQKRDTGVYLTILGYGMGNLKDNNLEQLAHHGNGHYAYVDSLSEAKKVFVDQGGALAVVAKDVKLQVEFNDKFVESYRLIGYENRVLKNEDFRNDAKDAGDMGSGHTCTALYEIVPRSVSGTPEDQSLTVRMRYKHPENDQAKEMDVPMPVNGLVQKPSDDFRFAASVAAFGMLLRDSEYKGTASFDRARTWANGALADDRNGLRSEFVKLVEIAQRLKK